MSNEKQEFGKKLYETKERTDLVITFNSVPYHVHALVLGIRSKYFNVLFMSMDRGQSMDIELELPFISQEAFEHFLKYSYGWELDMDYFMPMLYLSEHFQCDTLWKACRQYRLYKVCFCDSHASQFFQCILPKLTLDETSKVIGNTLLVDCVIWFTVHFDGILQLKVDTLKLIPLKWLRYVFGEAPFHVFEDELDRLDKARQLYFMLGESKELFSALFEGIRFKCISLRDMCGEKYMFLYQSDNDIVLDKLQSARNFDMSWMHNEYFFRENPSLVMKVDSKDSDSSLPRCRHFLAKNIPVRLQYQQGDTFDYLELSCAFMWRRNSSSDSESSVSVLVFAIQDDFKSWDVFSREYSETYHSRYDHRLLWMEIPRYSQNAPNTLLRMNVMSLTLKYVHTS
jgi:hypothetical protein